MKDEINFLYVQLGHATFGVGSSEEEAIADASIWLDDEHGQPGITYEEAEALVVKGSQTDGEMTVLERGEEGFDSYLID